MMTDLTLSNRTVSSSGVMLRTVPLASAAAPTCSFPTLPKAPNSTFIAERFMALHISSERRKPEVPSSVKRACNDLDFVHQYEAHGGVGQTTVGVQQGYDHRHIRCSDGNDQEKAKQQSQTDDYEE